MAEPERERYPVQVEKDAAVRQRMALPDLYDETLSFGNLVLGEGHAYTMPSLQDTNGTAVRVHKSFVRQTETGRAFIVESLDWNSVRAALEALPECGPGGGDEGANLRRRSTGALYASMPPPVSAGPKRHPLGSRGVKVAELAKKPSVRVDYRATLTSQTTLTADTTWLIGTVSCSSLTLEGNAVLKYKTNGSITVTSGSVTCKVSPGRPIIFTSVDDDSVGESMANYTGSGYTGTNSPGGYANPALAVPDGTTLNGCVFRFAKVAVANAVSPSSYTVSANHSQFVNCLRGVVIGYAPVGSGSGTGVPSTATLIAQNSLFVNVFYPIEYPSSAPSGLYNMSLTNCTLDHSASLYTGHASGSYVYIRCANSVFANITNSPGALAIFSGNNNGFYRAANKFGATQLGSDSVYPFQSALAGDYYLADVSGFRDAGLTTGISSNILWELRRRTTYPPVVISQTQITADETLTPQAPRDTDTLDIGFHAAVLDFAVGGVDVTNATLRVQAGTVVGTFGVGTNGYGIRLGQNARLICEGTPLAPVWILTHNTIQEQPDPTWYQPPDGCVSTLPGSWSPAPQVNCRFTQFSVLSHAVPSFSGVASTGTGNFQDCEFHAGKLLSSAPTINLTNCLLERVYTEIQPTDGLTSYVRNCLVMGGTFNFGPTNAVIRDNLFDRCSITNWIQGRGNDYTGAYNAYVINYPRLLPNKATDIVLSTAPTYRTGPLGDFYLLSTSTNLINADTTLTGGAVGLFHYTTYTNLLGGLQQKETNSWLDVTYHYVATDGVGVPIDTDADGLADHLENNAGTGGYASGSDFSNWQQPDTDNDCVSDYVEFLQGRNPRISGVTNQGPALNVYTPLK